MELQAGYFKLLQLMQASISISHPLDLLLYT
jgi:hypothetical protein